MSLRRKVIDYDTTFAELKHQLDAIFSFHALKEISGMDIYELVYDMCNAIPRSYADRVFVDIAEYIDKYTVRACEAILQHDDIVTAYAQAYERFELAADDISRGCIYLNRAIIPSSSQSGSRPPAALGKYKRQNVEDLAFYLWKTNVLFTIRDRYQNKLFYHIFELIRRNRDGEDVPYATIKTAITSLVHANGYKDLPPGHTTKERERDFQMYIEEFERPYLVHTKRYYETEAAREIASGSVSTFMRKATHRLQQEITRNSMYCLPRNRECIVSEFQAQYIAAYRGRFIGEFESMVKEEKFEDCSMAYSLLRLLPDGLKPVLNIYESYIRELGKDIVVKLGPTVSKNPRSYVDQLLGLYTKYYQINHEVFSGDPLCTAAVDKAFRTIVNDEKINKAANGSEVLARYCDMILKKNGTKKETKGGMRKTPASVDDSDPADKLTKMVTLFKYVDDKDVFQKFYSRMLAKRLIYGSSSSEELEIGMINHLKEACGVDYTSKLNKMFTDMSLSSDLTASFKDYLRQDSKRIGVGFDILVLTAGAWPLNQKEDPKSLESKVQIPAELESSVSYFEDFYGKHHNGRRLLWQWNLARAEIKLNYLDRPYELQVGFHQMVVLLLFNTASSMTVTDLISHSGLQRSDVLRSLKPLMESKILQTAGTEASDALSDSAIVSVNESFSSKRTKIKVTAAMQNETPQETAATRKAVDDDRRMYLQAAIVRIMKSRQALAHVQLVQELIDQAHSRFSPSVSMIKKCIEQLLEKQFIARQARDTYVYVA